MTIPFRFEMLDVTDPAAVDQYERAFFTAFQRATRNRLVRNLWRWDEENRRLATRVPYDEQLVWVLRDRAGAVESGMAFNIAMQQLQSAAFGFAPPVPAVGAFEVLTFFSVTNRDFRCKLEFWSRGAKHARARGFHTAYATTAQRPLRSYLRIGWELQAETEVESERRYFLRYDLDRLMTNG
jgi:hypothetical protein